MPLKPYNVRLTEDQVNFLKRVDNASVLLRRLIDQERLRSAVEDSSNKRILANSKIEELDDKINFLKKKLEETEGQLKNQRDSREFYQECSELINEAKEKGIGYLIHLSRENIKFEVGTVKREEGSMYEINIQRRYYDPKMDSNVVDTLKSFEGPSKEDCINQIERWVNERLSPISQEELRFKKACKALEEEIKILEDKKAAMVKEFLSM
ncbi:MAG: hypothetical protein H3Z53_11395 [archaeon]|nr:hypothetical protein [archaeon]MCP8314957.1 hypothetical protein [archaeon]